MRKIIFILLATISGNLTSAQEIEGIPGEVKPKYILVVHGGSGTMPKENMTPNIEKEYRSILKKALQEGYNVLNAGKSSLDGVQAAIHVLENSPLFNAGKGSVFANSGKNEMDAAIMDGSNLKAGTVSSISVIKNPIDAARAVMDQTEHVMLSGAEADKFAEEAGCEAVDSSYFYTEERWKQLIIAKTKAQPKTSSLNNIEELKTIFGTKDLDFKIGTVGGVALDKDGNLAAGTSTGGMTNKRYGRIGDSPIIGAGTYANNLTAGISCTGWGEYFIRTVAAHRVSALVEFGNKTLDEAAHQVINEIDEMGGDGGLIALDKNGNISTPFSTEGMYRGMVDEHGNISVYIYK
jgi:beta-aspartyl-peptidase (threonine type)